jgi:predicted nucleic acid-binding protein
MVISDASPIVAFIKKGELSMLKTIFTTIHLPKLVYDELVSEEGASTLQVETLMAAIGDKWVIVDGSSDTSQLDRYRIGGGEQDAIGACLANPDSYLLLMDDMKGRQVAKIYRIQTLGTLGIIKLAFKKRLHDKIQVMENVQCLLHEDFHLSSEIIMSFMRSLEN